MRIGVLAEAAGTTPRAVRHYHRFGLMAEPSRTSGGYREYAMADLVRLMRIRRLAGSGVPLGAISAMTAVDGSAHDVTADISDLIAGIEDEQKSLEFKKSRLLALLEDAKAGRSLSSLPRLLADRLDDLIDRSDGNTRLELERERDNLEVLALSGNLPEPLAIAMSETLREPESVASYLAVLTRWSALSGMDPASARSEIDALSTDVAVLLHSSNVLPVSGVRPAESHILPDLHDIVPDPAQRAVIVRVSGMLTEIGPQ